MHSLLIARYFSFACIVLLNLNICVFAAWHFTTITSQSGDLSIVDPYLVVISAMTVFFLPPIIGADLTRRNALPSRAWFEILWVSVLWLLELGGGARLAANASYFSCTTPFQMCIAPTIVLTLVWVCVFVLALHLLGLLVLTFCTNHDSHDSHDSHPLLTPISSHPYFHPPPPTFSPVFPTHKRSRTKLTRRRASETLRFDREESFWGGASAEENSTLGPTLPCIERSRQPLAHMQEARRSTESVSRPRYSQQPNSDAIPPVPPLPQMAALHRASVQPTGAAVSARTPSFRSSRASRPVPPPLRLHISAPLTSLPAFPGPTTQNGHRMSRLGVWPAPGAPRESPFLIPGGVLPPHLTGTRLGARRAPERSSTAPMPYAHEHSVRNSLSANHILSNEPRERQRTSSAPHSVPRSASLAPGSLYSQWASSSPSFVQQIAQVQRPPAGPTTVERGIPQRSSFSQQAFQQRAPPKRTLTAPSLAAHRGSQMASVAPYSSVPPLHLYPKSVRSGPSTTSQLPSAERHYSIRSSAELYAKYMSEQRALGRY